MNYRFFLQWRTNAFFYETEDCLKPVNSAHACGKPVFVRIYAMLPTEYISTKTDFPHTCLDTEVILFKRPFLASYLIMALTILYNNKVIVIKNGLH